MRLFLDASVLLAACGSAKGASREIFTPGAFLSRERAAGRLRGL